MAMVKCLRCGQEAPGISPDTVGGQPYPGELGKNIAAHICQACWEGWKKFSVNVINDYRLKPFLPQDRAVVERHMKQYLNLELQPLGADPITLNGQGIAVTFNTENAATGSVTKEKVIDMLEQIFDPEIPVNIYDLGLIYDVGLKGNDVSIKMTLTSRHCPAAQSLPATVREAVARIKGVREVEVEVVWEPVWTKDMITEEGKKTLGM